MKLDWPLDNCKILRWEENVVDFVMKRVYFAVGKIFFCKVNCNFCMHHHL